MLYQLIASIIVITVIAGKGKGKGKGKGNDNGQGNDSSDDCETESLCYEGVTMPNFCDYAAYQWDDPSTPLEDRNNIGRASLLSSTNILKANQLITQGKAYKLSYTFTNFIPAFGSRTWYTSLSFPGGTFGTPALNYLDDQNLTICGTGGGALDQRLFTSAVGNSGTQFDGLGHAFWVNGDFGDQRNYLFHNGFTGDDIMREHGVEYLGIEQMPPIITRAILIDAVGFLGQHPVPDSTQIDTQMVEDILAYQGMSVDDIEDGDVVLVHTGYAESKWFTATGAEFYGGSPGLTLDTVINIFGPKGVVMLGSDTFAVEFVGGPTVEAPLHMHWIVCNGGYLYENMNLVEWATDAQNGLVPYIGAFFFTPAQIEGGVGGLGTPVVIV